MKLALHVEAQNDLNELLAHFAARSGRLYAEQHLQRIETTLKTIESHPKSGVFDATPDVYTVWVPRTRFIVFYRIVPQDDRVLVLAIIDHAGHTKSKRRRLIVTRT